MNPFDSLRTSSRIHRMKTRAPKVAGAPSGAKPKALSQSKGNPVHPVNFCLLPEENLTSRSRGPARTAK
jgi:hypothetical protein